MHPFVHRAFADELVRIKLAGVGKPVLTSAEAIRRLRAAMVRRPPAAQTIKTPAWVAKMGPLKKVSGVPLKLLSNPKFAPYFERVAKGGKSAPRLFPGGPLVSKGMLRQAAPMRMAPQPVPTSFQMKSLL